MTASRGEQVDVIAGVRLTGAGRVDPFGDAPVDVHLRGGVITDIAPAGALPRRGVVVEGDGGWLVPGLWDHHVHTVQWALVAQRTPLGELVDIMDVGFTCAFLATPYARRLSGSTLYVDGGVNIVA